ncbi:unnamed protein product [Pleuronectes platessa]|uniref:Uncharacterized protein n=1 Tax=Pleuronectes platessa TaxID=8262 RepID=A0A9N7Y8X3_PLEPL|nr:unnamed protein product [Pleuronectes platessa]
MTCGSPGQYKGTSPPKSSSFHNSSRSESAGFSSCIGEREKPDCSSTSSLPTNNRRSEVQLSQLIFSRKPPLKSSFYKLLAATRCPAGKDFEPASEHTARQNRECRTPRP